MGRKTTIAVNTLLDNSGLRTGAQEAEGIMSGLGGKAKVALAAAGVATAAAFAKGFTDALDQNQLAAKFGEDIVARSATIYRDAWGDSLEEVAAAMKETERAFGEGADLDALTESAFVLSEAFDTDVNESMQTAAELAKSFGIEGERAFDGLTVAFGGLSATARDEVSSAVREYGDVFADMGISAENTLGLLAKFGEGGAIGVDKVGDAMKELSIRGTDMSSASAAAFEAMGKDQALYAELLLEGGDAASDAMFGIVRGLMAIEDPVEQANAAIALFGTPLEDLGTAQIPEFLKGLQEMGDGLGDTEGATAELGAQLSDSLGTKLESIKRQGLGVLADFMEQRVLPAAERVVDWFQVHWPEIRAAIKQVTDWLINVAWPLYKAYIDFLVAQATVVVDWFREHWPQIRDTIVTVVEAIVEKVKEYWPQIRDIIVTVVEAVVDLVKEHWPQIRDTIVTAVEAVQAVIERVVAVVSYIWERWGEEISEYASEAWANIQQVIGGALDIIQGVFAAFKALFEGDWDGLWEAVKQVLSGAKEVILGALDELWEKVKLAAKIAWDLVKTEVTDAVTAIPGLIRRGGFALFRAGWDLILRARDGIADAFERAASTVTGFITDLPGMLLAGADKVFDAMLGFGADIAGKIGAGIESAITDIGQAIWDSLPAPVQWGLEYGAGLVGTVSGLVSGSKDSDIEAAQEKALLAAAAENYKGITPKSAGIYHDGGVVMPNWSTGTLVGPNEAMILAEVGETVTPAGGGGGSFIGTLNVLERRTIDEELRVAWLLHGSRN